MGFSNQFLQPLGWRDMVFNGYLKEDVHEHKFEIQLHLQPLITLRTSVLGGHKLYAIFRSLYEAVETTFGEERAKEMIFPDPSSEQKSQANPTDLTVTHEL